MIVVCLYVYRRAKLCQNILERSGKADDLYIRVGEVRHTNENLILKNF